MCKSRPGSTKKGTPLIHQLRAKGSAVLPSTQVIPSQELSRKGGGEGEKRRRKKKDEQKEKQEEKGEEKEREEKEKEKEEEEVRVR